MDKKNQHYVPQFHLRRWSSDGKRISLFNKDNGIFVDSKASIKNVASKDYFYGEDGKIEDVLADIERNVSPIFNKIIEEKSVLNLSAEELGLVYLYIVLGNERTLATAERQEKFVKRMLYEVLETEQAHGKNTDINLDTFMDDITVKSTCAMSIKAALELYPLIFDLDLILIENLSEVEFLTSDYPTIKYNLWSIKRNLSSGWGMSSAGLMLLYPISPKFALMAYDQFFYEAIGERNGVLPIRKNTQIDEINKLMLLNAQSNLFFSGNVNQHYINKLKKNLPTYNEKDDPVQVFGNTNSKLFCFSGKRISYEANLKFLSIYEEVMHFPVPMHMQGLLRPASEEMAKRIKSNQKAH